MLKDLLRFYREAPKSIPQDSTQTLGEYLMQGRYSQAFIHDHLLPFGAAVWSTSGKSMLDYPAAAFIRFCNNHGLLQISNRPQWRTVSNGSINYVSAVEQAIVSAGSSNAVRTDFKVRTVRRSESGVVLESATGDSLEADQVVIAAHADEALTMLDQASDSEKQLLGVFGYEENRAVLHTDTRCMPRRRRAWCSWNYVESRASAEEAIHSGKVNVSYWMNRLQNLAGDTDYFVTLNPESEPRPDSVIRESLYSHPVFTPNTWQAQQELWSLQGRQRTWFCGSYFGSGFHEDAIQSGLAVAEQLGGIERPWQVADPSGRIVVRATDQSPKSKAA